MDSIKIKVDEQDKNYVESLDYELTSRKDIIAYMLSNNMNTNTDAFRSYQKEAVQFEVQYREAKRIIEEKYVLPNIGDHMVNWRLDYTTSELNVEFVK